MIKSKKHLFSLPNNITYLNCAYMSPQLKSVSVVGSDALAKKNLPFEIKPDDFFNTVEELCHGFSELINAGDPNRIAVIPSVSYGLATVAANVPLKRGEKVIVIEEQFPSNFYSWQRLTEDSKAKLITVSASHGEGRGKSLNQQILDKIDGSTKIVAIAHCHWADGTKMDLVKIRKKTKAVGALLIVDGTQSVGALPFDVKKIKPDALICAGYKWLMGPYSIGLAYYGPYFDNGKPIEENWINRLNSEQFSNLVNYQPKYKSKARKYSVGEQSNFILVPMMNQAIKVLNEWGVENIQSYCETITKDAIEKIKKLGYDIEDSKYRGHHLFGIRLPEHIMLEDLVNKLNENKIYVSVRGTSIRVAPNVYNTKGDLNKLYLCLKEIFN